MALNYYREIIYYLYACAQVDAFRNVPLYEIYANVRKSSSQDPSYDNEFNSSLLYLVEQGYVEDVIAHYRLTSSGMDYYFYLEHPPVDYPKKSLSAQHTSNTIAVISIILAVVGLIILLSQTHPGKLPVLISNNGSATPQKSIPIPLSKAITDSGANVKTTRLTDWFDQAPDNPIVDGVGFLLSGNSSVIETESQNSTNPPVIIIPVQQDNVKKIHLLINLCYSRSKYLNGVDVSGTNIASVCITSGQNQKCWDLKEGVDIRDWVIGSTTPVNPLANQLNSVWQGHHRSAGTIALIDHLVLNVPDQFTSSRLNYILIQDKSVELFASKNPGIMIFGVTIEIK
jgi:hypothetical protein